MRGGGELRTRHVGQSVIMIPDALTHGVDESDFNSDIHLEEALLVTHSFK